MRKALVVALAVSAFLLLVAAGFVAVAPRNDTDAAAGEVRRGEYLVTILACTDCHTPWVVGPDGPEPDGTRFLSGHPQDMVLPAIPVSREGGWWHGSDSNTAYAGPWGVSFTANLTPDLHTGLGAWTEEIFINAIRNGRHWGVARPILPPMPWQSFARMTDEDLAAVFAYLQTLPPIRNQVPLPIDPGG